jgi:hypothetical protein
MTLYLIGSLRNPRVPVITKKIRALGIEVFEDWFSAGKSADDSWKSYEQARGHSYLQALKGHAARHVFAFDHQHLSAAEAVVLVLPAGKSGHLELGWALGRGKRGYILLAPGDVRWDVMYQFADEVHASDKTLLTSLKGKYGHRD